MKKPTPRRRRRQASPPPNDGLKTFLANAAKQGLVNGRAVLVPVGSGLRLPAPSFGLQAHVIEPGKTKHGPRDGGKFEAAQYAIASLYPDGPPKPLNHLKLARDVNAVLRRTQPEFVAAYGEGKKGFVIDPQTVRRALRKYRERNC